MKKKKLVEIGIAIIVVGCLVTGYFYWNSQPKQYEVTAVTTGDITEVLSVSGDVKSDEDKTYYADFTAPIEVLNVEKGETVEQGEQLVSFDVSDLSLEARQSALEVQAADSQYQSTVKQNEKNTMIYQGAAMSEAAFADLIAKQRDVIRDLQAKVTKAANKQNDISVLQGRVTAEPDKDNKEDLQKTLDMWKGEYKYMKVPEIEADLTKQQTVLTDMENYRAQYESQKEAADTRLIDDSAQQEILVNKEAAALTKADKEETLQQANEGISASFTGVASEVYVEEGAVVNKGTPLFKIEDTSALAVEAKISKYDIGKVKVGQKADVIIAGNHYEGTVSEIDRVAIKDNTDKAKVPVTVMIDKPDEQVYIGIEADVDIIVNQKNAVQVLSMKGIYSDDQGEYCYVIRDGKVARQNVTVGIESENQVEILEGLTTGDSVIIEAITEEQIEQKAEPKKVEAKNE